MLEVGGIDVVKMPYESSDLNSSFSEDIHRGFRNLSGQNNCFLNSALQTLWHLPKFRRAVASFTSECVTSAMSSSKSPPILPPLQSLFANYQYGEEEVLPADDVREVLSAAYAQQGKFRIGEIDDAVECLEAILMTCHCEAVGVTQEDGGDDRVCSPSCPACETFRVAFFDMQTCSVCGALGDPSPRSDFLYRVWVHECLEGAPGETFQQSLLRLWRADAPRGRPCPGGSACHGKAYGAR